MKEDTWLFVASNPLAGVGQVMLKYKTLFVNHGKKVDFVTFEELHTVRKCYDNILIYVIPTAPTIRAMNNICRKTANMHVITICETETVHPLYQFIFEAGLNYYTPSLFCKTILERQFPRYTLKLLPHWTSIDKTPVEGDKFPELKKALASDKYKFYHIGNVADPRKQVNKIIRAFCALNLPNAELVLKATCKQPVQVNQPGVIVINGLISDEEINYIHQRCDCYVNFSHSEGVGMGNIDAALHGKPIIFPDYGGGIEYIKTPYLIKCGRTTLQQDDFLFQKGMEWGDPNVEQLFTYMKKCYEFNIKTMDHTFTENLMDSIFEDYVEKM